MRGLSIASAFLAFGAAASSAWALDIGDKAPTLEIKEWAKGDPVALDGKNIYVVEFWATWCPPCKKSIPHLCALADKYRGKGVEFVGISDEEPATVKEFLKTTNFTYHVACDSDKNTSAAYGIETIPQAFIVDKTGNVAWQGNPLTDPIEQALDQMLAGKYDAAKAKEAGTRKSDLVSALKAKDPDQMSAAAEKVLDVEPSNSQAFEIRLWCAKQKKDVAAFKTLVAKLAAKADADGDWRALNTFAWSLATDGDLNWRDVAAAFKAAKRSVEISQSKETDPLDTLARVYAEAGLVDQAIETQKKAVALDDKNEDLKKTLDYYLTCADLRKQVGVAAPKSKK